MLLMLFCHAIDACPLPVLVIQHIDERKASFQALPGNIIEETAILLLRFIHVIRRVRVRTRR